jgi:transcriptional regulator GlxA family with amidase domain
LHEIQQHIDLHLDEPLRVGELASRFGLSNRTLSRPCTTATGHGPLAYLQHVRVEHAKRLLESTNKPVDEVRCRVGYRVLAAFRRAFKDSAGLAPSEYRRAYGFGNS